MTDWTKLPNVDGNYFTERLGINAVAGVANEMRCIWRETPNKDVGIDGQIEYANASGEATGAIVAVQVKAGTSYMRINDNKIHYYPQPKHRTYWEKCPVPVILVIYDPVQQKGYWADVRKALRSPLSAEIAALEVPLSQVFDSSAQNSIFESCGEFGLPLVSIDETIRTLCSSENPDRSYPICFVDLFVQGLTDVCRKLFFSMSVADEVAEWRLDSTAPTFGIGQDSFEFIAGYVRFLVAQRLIEYDYSDYLIDWIDRELVPTFVAPITPRGRLIIERLRELDAGCSSRVLCERLLRIIDLDPTARLRAMDTLRTGVRKRLDG